MGNFKQITLIFISNGFFLRFYIPADSGNKKCVYIGDICTIKAKKHNNNTTQKN